MSEPAKDYPDIRNLDTNIDLAEMLLVEYQEVGEEFRNYERILNRSYYLSAIVVTFFAGAIITLRTQPNVPQYLAVGLRATGFVTFAGLGYAGVKYHNRRASAARLRDQIASDLHELTHSNVPRLQKVIVGTGRVWNQEDDGWFQRGGETTNGGRIPWFPPPIWSLLFLISVLFGVALGASLASYAGYTF